MAMNLDSMIDKVVLFLVIVALVPATLVSYFAVNTSSWDTATIAIWGILAIIFIVGLFAGIRGHKGR